MATKKQSIAPAQEDSKKVNLHMPDNIPVIYAEGVSHVALGYPVSKLMFHTGMLPGEVSPDGFEQRRAVLSLNIPTTALLDFCRGILANTTAGRERLIKSTERSASSIERVLDGLNVTPTPPEHKDGGA